MQFNIGDEVDIPEGRGKITKYSDYWGEYSVRIGSIVYYYHPRDITLVSAGTCTTPKEQKEMTQKETSQKETPPPKKNFEVGDKVRVTRPTKYGGNFDGTILDIQIKDDSYYLVRDDSPQGAYILPEVYYWKEKNLEKKEMSCCKETPVQIPATEISLQDAYERIRRELERNPLYYNAWKDKLTRQIENCIGADFADDDIYQILAGLFKLAKATATFASFH